MRIRALLLLLLVGWGLATPPGVAGQSIVAGTVSGTVGRRDGGSVSQALLTLRGLDHGFTRQTVANLSGQFTFGFVEPGAYELRAEALGFRPAVVTPVRVSSGDAANVQIDLSPAAPPVDAVDTVSVPGAGPSFWQGDGVRAGSSRISGLPDPYDDLSAVAALSSRYDPYLGSEGLPGELSLLVTDGVPFYRAMHPAMRGESLSTAMFSRAALAGVDAFDVPADIEWTGSAGGILALTSRSSVGSDGTALGGSWSGAPLWSSSTLDLQAPSLMSYWGAAGADVTLKPDTSRMFVSGEAIQVELPLEPRLPVASAALLTALGAEAGPALAEPAVERTRRASGLARFDWTLGTSRRLTMQASVGHLQREFTGFGPAGLTYGGAPPETGTDFSVAGDLITAYEDGLALEFRGGVTGSSRTYDSALQGVPATTLAGSGVSFGGPGTAAADVSRVDVHFSPVVHYRLGPGAIKGGATLRLSQHRLTYAEFDEGRYYFGDAAAAAIGSGAFVTSNGATKSSFATTEFGIFGQYAFDLTPGLRFSLGGRLDYEVLPASQIDRNSLWYRASGLANDEYPSKLTQFGGIGSLTWDVTGDGRTMLDGSMTVTNGDMEPALLHEAFTHDGRVKVSRYAGSAVPWPEGALPSSAKTAMTLSLLGPDSRAPRSTRASLGLVHHAGGGWNLYVGAVARRTDFLTRRRDLNLASYPVAVDEHGRDILGELRKLGAVVVAVPGGNRRFTGFDDVWALDTDGWSEYRGGSIGVEHRSATLDLFASYTRSQTRDNWIGAAAGVPDAQLPPGLPGEGDWAEGTSDFDVPDRLVAGATIGLGPERAVAVTGVVHYASGLPFTPGYRAGVDINGDGSALNDVAWVPGSGELSGLLSEWPCLNGQSDGFAERNSCRGSSRTGLDMRVRARLADVGGRTLELTVDAYGLVEREDGLRDSALLLVDPNGSITSSPDGGTTTVPLSVNPDFGKVLVPTGLGRMIRVGLRIGGAP